MKRQQQIILSIIFCYCLLGSALAQTIDQAALEKIVRSKVQEDAPGVAVGIVKDGEIIFEEYAGYANLAHQIEVGPQTAFNIASNAKQFTALCMLKLVLEGKASLEDDFRKYLPGYYQEIKDPIKIKHLITHSSGVRDYSDLMSLQGTPWWKRVGFDNDDALKLLKQQEDLNFKPGSTYQYSNSGYTLLTEVIAQITGVSFDEYSKELFEALGMKSTRFLANYMALVPNKALPYNNWGDGKWQQYPMVVSLHGDGFLYTTLRDQLTWEQKVQTRETELITTSQGPVANAEIESYGYGVEFKSYKGQKTLEHAGATGAYGAHFMRFPSEKTSIVVMSNNGNLWNEGLANEIANRFLSDNNISLSDVSYAARPTSLGKKPLLEELTGNYRLPPNGTVIKISVKNDTLYREIYQTEPVALLHEQGNLFQYASNPDLKIAFTKSKNAGYNFTLYHPQLSPRTARKIETKPVEEGDYASLNGTYRSTELNTEFTLTHQQGTTYEIKFAGDDYEGELVFRDFLQVGDYKLQFAQDLFGRVETVYVDFGRNRKMKFSKTQKADFHKSIVTSDGGTVVTATTSETYGKGKGDILLSKAGANGNEEWFKTFGGAGYDKASSIIQTTDGGYLITGSTSSFGEGNYDIYLIKTDSKGKLLWSNTYGAFYNDYGYVSQETENGFVVKGTKQECDSNTDINKKCKESVWQVTVDHKGKEISKKILGPVLTSKW